MKPLNVRWQVPNESFYLGNCYELKGCGGPGQCVAKIKRGGGEGKFSVNTALFKLNLASKSVVNSDRMSGIKLQQRYTNEGNYLRS